jgi:hypothetical protein
VSKLELTRESVKKPGNQDAGFRIISVKARDAENAPVQLDTDTHGSELLETGESQLSFNESGLCTIKLVGLPKPPEIEKLIESYVVNVELLPYSLKVILLDISDLVHLTAHSRKVFSGLLVEASRHYGNDVDLFIAGGPPMIRKYIEIFCKALRFGDKIKSIDSIDEAMSLIAKRLAETGESD